MMPTMSMDRKHSNNQGDVRGAAHEDLLRVADELDGLVDSARALGLGQQAKTLREAADTVGRAASGSWHGYHANVYYADLKAAPPGAHFSTEWGLMDTFGTMGSSGDWREYDPKDVLSFVYRLAGDPDIEKTKEFLYNAAWIIETKKSEIISILQIAIDKDNDQYLSEIRKKVKQFHLPTKESILEMARPKGSFMTRDTVVIGQKTRVPPHMSVAAEASAMEASISHELFGRSSPAGRFPPHTKAEEGCQGEANRDERLHRSRSVSSLA
jgi:hypothetical protein